MELSDSLSTLNHYTQFSYCISREEEPLKHHICCSKRTLQLDYNAIKCQCKDAGQHGENVCCNNTCDRDDTVQMIF